MTSSLSTNIGDRLKTAAEAHSNLENTMEAFNDPELTGLKTGSKNAQRLYRSAVIGLANDVQSLYTGIEGIYDLICKKHDGFVPQGDNTHQQILDQMLKATPSRPALLDAAEHKTMVELKNFRHVVRKNYGIKIDPTRVFENAERMAKIWDAINSKIKHFAQRPNTPDSPSV